ncbi:phospholipase D-like domain-containing protein [Zooshikella ganghwensis]|uniref:PLD phosphodiesterase domain-containing protein n=1 Tax=Zooshikella ganghwensis TaxID=202772 RepID=A0A4P9VNW3_9GAMM|nr:phospholipase D-like domain-containing protein [Zooshikella ganghwensis]RDH45155.1 hypothetical protein B9G39_17855 [Zooshikella ganghwensis]
MKLTLLVLSISIVTLNTSSASNSSNNNFVSEKTHATSQTISSFKHNPSTLSLPNLNDRVDQILIDHFNKAGIDNPENIIVTVGIMTEANIDVPSNTALLSADWLSRQTRPTTFAWSQIPLLNFAKMRAFGSSAPANRSYLAGAHRIGQPVFPIPTGGPTSVLLDSQGKRIAGHPDWPDLPVVEQAIKDTMDIKIEDHHLIDFAKIHWEQRYGLPKGLPPFNYIEWKTINGSVADERRHKRQGHGKAVADLSDIKTWHVDHKSIPLSAEATHAFFRVLRNQTVDASDWAYMITAQIRAESTDLLSQSYKEQLQYAAALAYRSTNVNNEAGELSSVEISTINQLLNGNQNVTAFIPHLPAKGYAPFNLNGVKSTGHIPTITSKNHVLVVDEASGVFLWYFAGGPLNGFRGGFTSKEEAITWYKNWLTNHGGRASAKHKGDVYPYYNSNFEAYLILDESGWWSLKKTFNFDLSHWRREKADQLKLLPIGNISYGRAMADQFFKATRADIDSQYKQRNEQFAEDLRYWYDFAATAAAILGVGTSGHLSKVLDFSVIAGGVGVGGVTIANADNPSEVLEGIGAIIEAAADTMEATGVGDRLSRKSSTIGNLFRGGSTKTYQRIAQKADLNQPVPIVFENKAPHALQRELSQIWNSPQRESTYNARKLDIIKDDKHLECILYQGKGYARHQNGNWFSIKLDLSLVKDAEIDKTNSSVHQNHINKIDINNSFTKKLFSKISKNNEGVAADSQALALVDSTILSESEQASASEAIIKSADQTAVITSYAIAITPIRIKYEGPDGKVVNGPVRISPTLKAMLDGIAEKQNEEGFTFVFAYNKSKGIQNWHLGHKPTDASHKVDPDNPDSNPWIDVIKEYNKQSNIPITNLEANFIIVGLDPHGPAGSHHSKILANDNGILGVTGASLGHVGKDHVADSGAFVASQHLAVHELNFFANSTLLHAKAVSRLKVADGNVELEKITPSTFRANFKRRLKNEPVNSPLSPATNKLKDIVTESFGKGYSVLNVALLHNKPSINPASHLTKRFNSSPIGKTIKQLFDTSLPGETIKIRNEYLDSDIRKLIISAITKGVNIELIQIDSDNKKNLSPKRELLLKEIRKLNSINQNSGRFTFYDHANRSTTSKHNVKFGISRDHAKTYILERSDKDIIITGSYNLDDQSIYRSSESVLLIEAQDPLLKQRLFDNLRPIH